MLLLVDNFDSFTYNLYQYLSVLGAETRVVRNDVPLGDCLELDPDLIVISPGPGGPADSGVSKDLIEAAAGKIPLLGVCLGHQCLAEVFGGKVVPAERVMHGKTSAIHHSGEGIFEGLPQEFVATRYHSLIVDRESLPSCLEVTAETEEGEIMGLRHRELMLEGVQFHPESILTKVGMDLLRNFFSPRSHRGTENEMREGKKERRNKASPFLSIHPPFLCGSVVKKS